MSELNAVVARVTERIVERSKDSRRRYLELMEREHEIDRDDGLALASVVVDLRVTQVVNGAQGVHAVLRYDALG